MTWRHGAGRQRAFTLIELMIAVAIFALMTLFAYASVNQVITARIIAAESLGRLSDIQFMLRQLALDLEQLHPRPVREELGDSLAPALVADLRRYNQLELTRAGWRNPIGAPRSSLQRVAYRLEDGELIRSHWNVLDRLQVNAPIEFTLIEGLETVEFRFMRESGDWISSWPDPDLPPAAVHGARPRAVEVILAFDDPRIGTLRRVVEVLR